ncbi:hypothetical protein BH10PSE6_BH10PSE6_44880 [soil metagenome]
MGNRVPAATLRHMCVLVAATTLSGCGWFDGGWFGGSKSPLSSQPQRVGADRQTVASGLPPAPQRGTYDGGQAPVDDTRSQAVGTIVTPKGGQKAQLESREKERAQREAEQNKERERRLTEKPSAEPSSPATAPSAEPTPPSATPAAVPPAPPAEPAPPPAGR